MVDKDVRMISKEKVSFEKYKQDIQANAKSADEITEFIKNKFTVEKIELEKLSFYANIMFDNAKKNLISHLQSNSKTVCEDKFDFTVFRIENDKSSSRYFKEKDSFENCIYIVIEKSARYIFTNSSVLQNELLILRGISQYDIDNDTVDFRSYLFYLSRRDELGK